MSRPLFSPSGVAWLAVFSLLVLAGGLSWKALRDAKPAEAASGGPGPRPPSTVIVRPVEEKEVVERLLATGSLRAARRAEVASRESAAVEALLVTEGDEVEEGGVLARLDGRRVEAQLQEGRASLTAAEAELAQREAEHERAILDEGMMRELWDERAVSEREFLDSAREMKVASARERAAGEAIEAARKRLELLEVRLADLEVKAPFDGRVVMAHTEVGEWLSEGDPVVTLVSVGEVEAWLELPERHAAALMEARPESVEIRLPGRSDGFRADRVSLVPDVEGRSRLFTLIAHLSDPDHRMTPGSSVEARVPLGRPRSQRVISSDAVLTGFSGSYVFVPDPVEHGPPVAKRVPVEIGFERDGMAVLTAGQLEVGDEVIVEGNERLFPGTPLDPNRWQDVRSGPPTGGAR